MNNLIEKLSSEATLSDVIYKINEIVDIVNQNLKEYININIETNSFSEQSFDNAKALVPGERRVKGLRMRFLETSQGWNEYIWLGGDWDDLTTWTKETVNGGDWV